MTPNAIAKHLRSIYKNECEIRHNPPQFIETIADAIITIDSDSASSPRPSSNYNGVYFMGCHQKISESDLDLAISYFYQNDIQNFFFWLSPGPQVQEISQWLLDRDFYHFQGAMRPAYPTLTLQLSHENLFEFPHNVQRINTENLQIFQKQIRTIPFGESFISSCGFNSYEHYLYFEEDIPIGIAVLAIIEDFGYLTWAGTAEEHRGKGVHKALISARLYRAAELGLKTVCSETLTILEDSLANLKYYGFTERYSKQVFSSVPL